MGSLAVTVLVEYNYAEPAEYKAAVAAENNPAVVAVAAGNNPAAGNHPALQIHAGMLSHADTVQGADTDPAHCIPAEVVDNPADTVSAHCMTAVDSPAAVAENNPVNPQTVMRMVYCRYYLCLD